VKLDLSALKYATIILFIIAAVFLAVSTAINQVDASTLPPFLADFTVKLQAIFAMPSVVFIITWVRNVYGYYNAKAQALAENAEVNYNLNKLYQTIGLYVGSAAVFAATIPPPYSTVAMAIIFVGDVARTELARILKK